MKKDVSMESPKLPYTKPTLTKHQPLRDITAGGVSSPITMD
ncbi:hypothetical protein MELA_01896 [Candidatus Methylomirabilis lanthanidiphila]|uniref:Uncharacterized protein n=1 Tax=Candidatus Methylomirabilis lanthanidiphila TaxID=2211376 RepID=A0A564ZJJ8_9BACT|nr:hypothetical protein MELA_01896 [Candidatus Methylomirabilis lanthanidiphila]